MDKTGGKEMGIKRFTRLFGGTVYLENGCPKFGSKAVPKHGDEITTLLGSTLQVQRVGDKLVEKFINGPPRGITLPPNWTYGGFEPEAFKTEL